MPTISLLTCNSTGRLVIERECRGFDPRDVRSELPPFFPGGGGGGRSADATRDYIGRFVSLARGIPSKK